MPGFLPGFASDPPDSVDIYPLDFYPNLDTLHLHPPTPSWLYNRICLPWPYPRVYFGNQKWASQMYLRVTKQQGEMTTTSTAFTVCRLHLDRPCHLQKDSKKDGKHQGCWNLNAVALRKSRQPNLNQHWSSIQCRLGSSWSSHQGKEIFPLYPYESAKLLVQIQVA